MKKILVIGNGFYIHYGLKTKYVNFKKYLRQNNLELFNHIKNIIVDTDNWSFIENDLLINGFLYFENELSQIIESNNFTVEKEYDVCEPSTCSNGHYIDLHDIQGFFFEN